MQPAKIILSRNYRSDARIIQFTNILFQKIMNVKESTEKYGEDDIVDWFPKNDSPDALVEFASYTPKNKTEIVSDDEDEDEDIKMIKQIGLPIRLLIPITRNLDLQERMIQNYHLSMTLRYSYEVMVIKHISKQPSKRRESLTALIHVKDFIVQSYARQSLHYVLQCWMKKQILLYLHAWFLISITIVMKRLLRQR